MCIKKFDRVFGVTRKYRVLCRQRAAVDLVARVVQGRKRASFKPAFDCRCARSDGKLGEVGGMKAPVLSIVPLFFPARLMRIKGFSDPQTGRQGDGR